MPSNISNDYIITNYSSSLGENTIAGGSGSAGTPAQAASGKRYETPSVRIVISFGKIQR